MKGPSLLRAVKIILTTVGGVAVVAYPLIVYFGMARLELRTLALLLAALLLPMQLARLTDRQRAHLWAVLPLPLGIMGLLGLAALVDDHRFILALPVLINLTLLAGFVSSLRDTPLVERFARMQVEDLPNDEVAYCRRVTVIWSVFLGLNALVCLALALAAPLSWWTLYTGAVAYLLMGLLFASEFLYRKWRFRRFGSGLPDRLLARIFPARSE